MRRDFAALFLNARSRGHRFLLLLGIAVEHCVHVPGASAGRVTTRANGERGGSNGFYSLPAAAVAGGVMSRPKRVENLQQ
jgi:hypothetical protein